MFKFTYWTILPVAIGFFLFYYIDKMNISIIEKIIIFMVVVIPIATIRVWIGKKIFKEKKTLTDKIMSCSLRRINGYEYCARCPDSYECATDVDDENVKSD